MPLGQKNFLTHKIKNCSACWRIVYCTVEALSAQWRLSLPSKSRRLNVYISEAQGVWGILPRPAGPPGIGLRKSILEYQTN